MKRVGQKPIPTPVEKTNTSSDKNNKKNKKTPSLMEFLKSEIKKVFRGSASRGQANKTEAGDCASCIVGFCEFRCTRCGKQFCTNCIETFGLKAAKVLLERVYGKTRNQTLGTAKIFDAQGRAFCPTCYGSLLERAQRTGDWRVKSQEEMDPSCVRITKNR